MRTRKRENQYSSSSKFEKSSFSASFGGFEFLNADIKLYQIDQALQVLFDWAKSKNFEGIKIMALSP